MPIPPYPDLFNDVFGPIMQPGSSSHTAGPCRIGYLARGLLGEAPRAIHVLLDAAGSFAGAFGVMAEDRAMIAGALGCLPDDERLFDAFAIAEQAGIAYRFEFGRITESRHPNAVKFTLTAADGRAVTLVADSTGGGMIETRVVDGYELRTVGDAHVLLVFEPGEELAPGIEPLGGLSGSPERPAKASIPKLMAGLPGLVEIGASATEEPLALQSGIEASAGLSGLREQPAEASIPGSSIVPGRQLFWARLSQPPDLDAIRQELPGSRVALLAPVLPVLDTPARKPRLFDTMVRWREIAAERGLSLAETAIQYELDASGWSREQVVDTMRMIERAMHRQTHAVYEEPLDVPATPFRPDMAADWARHMASPRRLTDGIPAQTLKWAYGAGAGIPGVPTEKTLRVSQTLRV